jgi:hypothetical protein
MRESAAQAQTRWADATSDAESLHTKEHKECKP